MAALAVTAMSLAQQQSPQQRQPRKIHLLHANTLNYDKRVDPDRQTLHGDVQFRQDSCYMYCDSAYFYENSNSMAAFGNVRMQQGDTLFVYCDSLFYDGNALFGELYDNVHLVHMSASTHTHLYTSYMTYDREVEEANYPDTGVMVDSIVHLRSQIGWYYLQRKLAFFQYDVEGRTYERDSVWQSLGCFPPHDYDPDDERLRPEFMLFSDTLRYDFDATLATVLGPSRIVNDSSVVHTRRGNFNTSSQEAHLYDHSWIESPGRFATADTLFYNSKTGYGEAWGHVHAIDTTDCMQVRGDYAYYIDNDSTPQMGFITGRALAMEYSSGDTLFLHADTLRAYTILNHVPADTISHQEPIDTLGNTQLVIDAIHPAYVDSLRFMQAYYNVRYYRSDLQGVCDSLIYAVKDSLATFVGNPVMWNSQYQITGDSIFAIVTRNGIQRAMIHPNAFLTQSHDESLSVRMDTLSLEQQKALRIDTIHYDQILGNNLVCLFDSGRVQRLDMDGNVQIINYPEEKDKTLIGLNQVIGNYLTVWFKNQKMEMLKIWPQPIGSLTPIPLVTDDMLFLNNFRWMAYLRPTGPEDVFRGIEMKAEDKQEIVKLFDEDELNGY